MGGHRLTGPDRTGFPRGRIANSKDKIHARRSRLAELFPALAAQFIGGKTRGLQLLQRFRPHSAHWMATSAVSGKLRESFMPQNGLGHDGARRVAGTEKENVVTKH